MKKIKNILILGLIFGLFITSCDDNFLDVNTDPDSPTTVTPDFILPVAQFYSANLLSDGTTFGNNRSLNTLGNFMVNNWSQSNGFSFFQSEFEYDFGSTDYQRIWNYAYTFPLVQYQDLDNGTYENGENYTAIAKIMKSLHFQTLVDAYGDIPYTEALQRGGIAKPVYDNGLDIYEDLIVQLDTAIDLINNATSLTLVPGVDDIMYGGNMTEWKKLANTVKLRILVRQSDMAGRGAYIATELAKINAEGSGYITTDATVNPGYLQQANKQNPMWNRYGQDLAGANTTNHDATCATQYVLDKLTAYSDPRIDFIYEIPANGPHLGIPQGTSTYPPNTTEDWVSNIGPGLLKNFNQDAVIFALADLKFLQAEAIFKGIMSGTAADAFNEGVQASFSYLGAGSSAGYTSSGNPMTDYTASANKLETIMVQKWIALNGIDPSQNWFDWSRTGFPNDLPVSLMATTSNRPVRLHYPATELTSNSENVPTQPDVFTAKIFWAN